MFFSEAPNIELTCTDVLEHCFCPRFTYFELVLDIPEQQHKRFKVLKGREVHEKVTSINKSYLRRKIGCISRRFNVHLSTADGLVGIIDELLSLDDNTMAPLDYKFAEFSGHVYKTHIVQAAFYSRLIEASYNLPVRKAFLVYTRSKNRLVEIPMGQREKKWLDKSVAEIRDILATGCIPTGGGRAVACKDCCYKNICDRGSEH